MCDPRLCSEHSFLTIIHTFGSYNAPSPPPHLLRCFLSLGRKGRYINVPFTAGHSTVSYSLPLDQLWVSVLIAIPCLRSFSDAG